MNILIENHLIKLNIEHVLAKVYTVPWWSRLMKTRKWRNVQRSLQTTVSYAKQWHQNNAKPGYSDFDELAIAIVQAQQTLK